MNKTKTMLLITAMIFVAVFFIRHFTLPTRPGAVLASKNEIDSFAFVRSMQGTTRDGEITENSAGELLVDAQLRLMFEYYLAATGEQPLDFILKGIEAELDKKLNRHASAQAKALLSSYIRYKQALAEAEKNQPQVAGNSLSSIRLRLSTMQELRRQFFSAKDAQAMFGFDDAYDTDALARLEISQNPALDETQKQAQMKALDAQMSAELREAKSAPYQVIRLEESAQKLRAGGASEDEVYRMRAAATTPEAAARLAELDREELEWKNRVASYLAEKKNLEASLKGRSDEERQAALQHSRDERFSKDQQKRLGAYE